MYLFKQSIFCCHVTSSMRLNFQGKYKLCLNHYLFQSNFIRTLSKSTMCYKSSSLNSKDKIIRNKFEDNKTVLSLLGLSQSTLIRTLHKNVFYCTSSSLNSGDKSVKDKFQENKDNLTLMEKFVNSCHPTVRPYLRLVRFDKPTGMLFLLWPCYWSLSLAASPGCFPDPLLLAIFGTGAFLMRSAGCIINDLWDKDIDSKVSRTKHRPLACNEISTLDAWMLLGGKLSLALLLLLQLNWFSIVLGATSLVFVITYPLVKRFSYWPQMMLGITFNWGAMLGWSAVHGSCDWLTVLPLYISCISWTLIYDTIYAHQDKVDDVLIKIKSTAIKFGENTKYYLTGFSTSMIGFLTLAGYTCHQTWPFYASVGFTAACLTSQIASLNINDPQSCWKTFKANQKIGLLLFLGIMCGTLVKKKTDSNSKSSIALNEPLLPATTVM